MMTPTRMIAIHCLAVLATVTAYSQLRWTRSVSNPVLVAATGNPNSLHVPYYALGPAVLWDREAGVYRAWFESLPATADRYSISHALSLDGALWYYCAVSPVLESGERGFDSKMLRGPCVINDDRGYRMYYCATDGSRYSIGLARSSDGVLWEKHVGNPVLGPGPPGSWDNSGVLFCKVLRIGQTYYMWYSGRDGLTSRIGLATSSDGVTWRKHPANPVVSGGAPGTWDTYFVEAPAVVFQGGIFYMVYTARPQLTAQQIGLAISRDGITWTKYPGNPVFTGQANWEGANVAVASLLLRDSVFHLWYSANGSGYWQTGYATSRWEYVPSFGLDLIENPGFELGRAPWTVEPNIPHTFSLVGPGRHSATAVRLGGVHGDVQVRLVQNGIHLKPATKYRFSFDAYSKRGGQVSLSITRQEHRAPDEALLRWSEPLDSVWQGYVQTFWSGSPTGDSAGVEIRCALSHTAGEEITIDNVRLSVAQHDSLYPPAAHVSHETPGDFYLHQAYPDPLSATRLVEFGIPAAGHTSLEIYNTAGDRVVCLIGRRLPAGRHHLTFSDEGFHNGLYIYRLTVTTGTGSPLVKNGKLLLFKENGPFLSLAG